jgi:hypothetical protein
MIGFIATLATRFEAIFTHFMIAFFARANAIIKPFFANMIIDIHLFSALLWRPVNLSLSS